MTPLDPRLRETLDELANALQTAVLLAGRLQGDLSANAQNATTLHQAVARAVAALETLRKGDAS
jgi:hypothetical protein